jgi:predicted O-linked N-acetylglucosamine transferase (SPINDLY family)
MVDFPMPSVTVQQAFDLAQFHHKAGRLAEAENLYRQVLGVQPNHAESWHFLGLIAYQIGRHDLAAEWMGKAIVLDPKDAATHSDLGEVHRAAGRLDEAVAAYRRALEINSNHVVAYNNLGIALAQLRRFGEATAEFRRAIELSPGFVEAMNNLGIALMEQGQHDEAVAVYCRAIELRPDNVDAHHNLGKALKHLGQLGDAREAFRRAIQLKPDHADALNNLGMTLSLEGDSDEAIGAFENALRVSPDHAEARNNLGNLLRERGRLDEAIELFHRAIQDKPDSAVIHLNLAAACMEKGLIDEAVAAYRRAAELWPDSAETWIRLGVALQSQGRTEETMTACGRVPEVKLDRPEACNDIGRAPREKGQLDEAVAAYRRAIEISADLPDAWSNLGIVLRDQGRLEGAISAFRRALQLRPNRADLQSDIILTLLLCPDVGSGSIAAEERRWNEQFGHPSRTGVQQWVTDCDPNRRLRIGYVSPDFREHVVGRNLRPLFQHHDRENFEIVCYSGVLRPDGVTEEFRKAADLWRDVSGVDDDAMCEQIRKDRIDVLVDLSQHSAENRLPVFARKPAPVQVSFAGYPESTGVEAIGYRISDRWMEGEGNDSRAQRDSQGAWGKCRMSNVEYALPERVFLIDSFWCYDPCGMEVAVNELPARENGGITFGSLNSFCKINDRVLKLWARALVEVAGSRLVVLTDFGSQQERTWEFLKGEGVAPERVEFVGRRSRKAYLELYQRLDIGLDPFPYGGHTTCQDALWMGVPVVSLAGTRAVSRAGLSILNNVGLADLVAFSEDEYVRIAAGLAGDLSRLAELRRTLRARMESSVLMDGTRFARSIAAAYRAIWRDWCGASAAP